MLKEGDHGGRHGNHLLRGHIHVLDLFRTDLDEIPAVAGKDQLVCDAAFVVQMNVALRDDIFFFLGGVEIFVLVGNLAAHNFAIRRFDETELVDPGIYRRRYYQTDVGPFRSLDGTHSAVVGSVNVAYFETGAFAGQAARTESGKRAFVPERGQGIGLLHKLGQLSGEEERLHHRNQRVAVDEVVHSDLIYVRNGHALLNDAGDHGKPRLVLLLQKFAHGAHPAVG